jgi:hypothetical protein
MTCDPSMPATSCGLDTICGGLLGSGDGFCELACGTSADCRNGFECIEGGCVPGMTPTDGGSGPGDAGAQPGDAGSERGDAGSHPGDGGLPGHDGGMPGTDGGGTSCSSGLTMVTGTVHAPTPVAYGSADPIYGATVYIPSESVGGIDAGVSCLQCGAPLDGVPAVVTTTAADGSFVLMNPPTGARKLVVELGRWRRVAPITVNACVNNAIPDDQTRLPRKQSEGNIPQIAMVTGSADPLECVLRKIGIADAEFTNPDGGGRVHFYVNTGSTLDGGSPPMSDLIDNPATLGQYDVVVLACAGQEIDPSVTEQDNLIGYANNGGRIFATHYGYVWFDNDAPFSTTATWDIEQTVPTNDSTTAFINQGTDAGMAFAEWADDAGVSMPFGEIAVNQYRHDFDAVTPPSVEWLSASTQPLTYSFDAQVGMPAAAQCGRALYSDFHAVISASATPTGDFPTECDRNAMTPQEKALEFLFFQLQTCVGTAH